jgi:hypothetical protein
MFVFICFHLFICSVCILNLGYELRWDMNCVCLFLYFSSNRLNKVILSFIFFCFFKDEWIKNCRISHSHDVFDTMSLSNLKVAEWSIPLLFLKFFLSLFPSFFFFPFFFFLLRKDMNERVHKWNKKFLDTVTSLNSTGKIKHKNDSSNPSSKTISKE